MHSGKGIVGIVWLWERQDQGARDPGRTKAENRQRARHRGLWFDLNMGVRMNCNRGIKEVSRECVAGASDTAFRVRQQQVPEGACAVAQMG